MHLEKEDDDGWEAIIVSIRGAREGAERCNRTGGRSPDHPRAKIQVRADPEKMGTADRVQRRDHDCKGN
jgi:hypothetical protein